MPERVHHAAVWRSNRTSRHRLRFIAIGAIGLGVLLAPWLAAASVHIVGWSREHVERVAVLPLRPTATSAAAAAVLLGSVVLWRKAGRRSTPLLESASPLLLVWLLVVPYLPGLADRFPLLLTLAGPLRWFVLLLAGLGCGWPALLAGWRWMAARVRLGPRAVFAVSLVLYLALGLLHARQVGPGGDEPHYLVITHSLLVDQDLAIENNHRLEHYRAFFDGYLPPHYLRRGLGGVIYSVHAPGLAALVLPAYALGGYPGVVVFLCVLAAWVARVVYELAEAVAGRAAAAITWAAVTLTVPFVPHAWLIYPELPATLIVAWTARWLWYAPPGQVWRWALRGAALALLPWLHTKFSLLLAMLTLTLLVRRAAGLRSALALIAPIGISLAGWLATFDALYGTPDPTVPYGSVRQAGLAWSNVPRGLLGLAFDQEFGLLLYSPIYWFVGVGAWRMLRRAELRGYAISLVAAAGALLVSVTTVYMWWGGWSAPARFLVPTLPLAAPLLAAALAGETTPGMTALARALLLVSVGIAAFLVGQPSALRAFNDRDGVGNLVEAVQGGAPLSAFLPSFLDVDWTAQGGRVLVWVAAAVAGGVGAAATTRLHGARRSFWMPVAGFLAFGLAFAMVGSTVALPADTRQLFVWLGRAQLLEVYDGDRTLVFRFPSMTRLDEKALLKEATLTVDPQREPPDEEGRLAGPFRLVPGDYLLRVWFHGTRRLEGELALARPRALGAVVRARGPFSNPTTIALRVPVPVDNLWLKTSTRELGRRLRWVALEPHRIEPKSTRAGLSHLYAIEHLDDGPSGYLLYLDRNAYPEDGRFWTVPGRTAEVWVAPSGARAVVLRLHVGPTAAAVDLTVRQERRTLHLPPWEPREVQVGVEPDERFVPVRVATMASFRPSDLDPRSQDVRQLGCHVEVRLLAQSP